MNGPKRRYLTSISIKANLLYKLRSFESLFILSKVFSVVEQLPLCLKASRWRCLAPEKAFLVLLLLWCPWRVKHSSRLFGMM